MVGPVAAAALAAVLAPPSPQTLPLAAVLVVAVLAGVRLCLRVLVGRLALARHVTPLMQQGMDHLLVVASGRLGVGQVAVLVAG